MSNISKRFQPVKSHEIIIKTNRINYEEAAHLFEKNDQVFFHDITVKQASYAHKRLELLCKCKLDVRPAYYAETREEGYLFTKTSE